MSSIQVADQTFVAAPGARVAQAFASPRRWKQWWPDLTLAVTEDRGDKGIRWVVEGAVTGTMELWLEASLDGVIVHYFLHAEPSRHGGNPTLGAEQQRFRVAGKQMAFALKEELEAGRAAGEPPGHVTSDTRAD